MSLLKNWAPYFQSAVKDRGRSIHLAGKVVRHQTQAGEYVRAQVVDDTNHATVVIHHKGLVATPHCTCSEFSAGTYCCHLWAALLQEKTERQDDPASTDRINYLRPGKPKARKREPGRQVKPADADWINRLTLLRPTRSESIQSPISDLLTVRQICYVVNIDQSNRSNSLVIELWAQTATPRGWSPLRPFKIDLQTLEQMDDPIDCHISSLLLGAQPYRLDTMDYTPLTAQTGGVFSIRRGIRQFALRRMAESGRCLIDDGEGMTKPLVWDNDEPWVLWIAGSLDTTNLKIDLQLRRGAVCMDIKTPLCALGGNDGVVIYDGKVAPFDDHGSKRWVNHFRDELQDEPLRVPAKDIDSFLDRLYLLPQLPMIEWPDGVGRNVITTDPVVNLDLTSQATPDGSTPPANQNLDATVWFEYHGMRVNPGQSGRYVPIQEEQKDGKNFNRQSIISRNLKFEGNAISLLSRLGFRPHTTTSDSTLILPAQLMAEATNLLLEQGWHIRANHKSIRQPTTSRFAISTGLDWFELRGGLKFETEHGEQIIRLPDAIAASESGQGTILLDDGSQGILPEQWLRRHGLLADLGTVHGDHLRFQTNQVVLLDALLEQQEIEQADSSFLQAQQRLHQFDRIEPINEPDAFHGTLRAYQREGLGWLRFLRWFGTGGILADDMGLGKTVQVLAMLEAKHRGGKDPASGQSETVTEDHESPQGPSLIIVPRSVIFNWNDESSRFTPDLRVGIYSGPARQSMRESFGNYDLIVTSYGLMRRDILELREHKFEYVVLDEAQAIKNSSSQSAKAARLLQARHRLALTGTPVENHLGDLWSIFEFLNPGMLNTTGRFARSVGASVQNVRNKNAAGEAAIALRPFILRRTKQQVLEELPEKTEQTIVCQMEPMQQKLYDQLLKHYRQTLLEKVQTPTISGSALTVLEALLRLRQAACHPGLIDPKLSDQPAAKVEVLLEQLAELQDEGHKALVFSQFTSLLALVRNRLDHQNIRYEYLDGRTRDRKQRVEHFQNDPDCKIFLISLKAGGFGLNLTAADYVFILDPWWNPAVEAQAIDRAHRIGQTRHVFAYRLICDNTVEQRITELQQQKQQLAEAIVDGHGGLIKNLSREDLQQLLS